MSRSQTRKGAKKAPKREAASEKAAPKAAEPKKDAAGPSAVAEGVAAPKLQPLSMNKSFLAMLLAWLVPGAGHFFLGRRGRAVTFLVLVLLTLTIGWQLGGKLYWSFQGSPLAVIATWGCLGSGLPYLFLRFGLGYTGDITGPGWEYGKAFIITAGLMNLLLLLDVWDIARGRKT